MTLSDWLRQSRLSHDEFADRIGCDRSSVTRYVHGNRMPRPEVLRRIAEVTGGAVTANDFVAPAADDDEARDAPEAA